MRYSARYFGLILLMVLATSSCDCESRIRSMIGQPGDRAEQDQKAEQRRAPSKSSAPREHEPNDFPAQATLLELGGDLRPVRGALSSPTDHDWYALTSQNGESWQVELTVVPTTPSLDLMIQVQVPGSPGTPAEYNIGGAGEAEAIPILAVSEKPQRILVQSGPDGSNGDYQISFKKRLSGGAVEAEPNDEVDAATAFEAPGMIEGFYDRPGDRDIFYIAPSQLEGSLVNLEVRPVEGIVQTVKLYTSRDLKTPYLSLQIPPDSAAGVPNLRIPDDALGVWVVLSAGQKFSRNKSYQLRMLAHPPVKARVEEEPNNSAQIGHKIEVGMRLSGYFHEREDVDYFRIYVDGIPREDAPDESALDRAASNDVHSADELGEDADAEAGGAGEPGGVRDPLAKIEDKEPTTHLLRVSARALRDEARVGLSTPASSDEESDAVVVSEPGAEAILCNRSLHDGYLDILVRPTEYPDAGLQQDFDYELVTEDLARLDGLEVEPNNTDAQADKLLETQKRVGFIGSPRDADVFAFAVSYRKPIPKKVDIATPAGSPRSASKSGASQTRSVALRLSPNPANLSFELRDDEGGLVAQVNRAGAGGEERLRMDLPSGLYFVHVRASGSSACKPYELSYELRP